MYGYPNSAFAAAAKFRIVIARAERFAGVRRSGHRVDIRIVGISRMSVMIERRDLLDLRQQALVDLLNVWAGKRPSLGRAQAAYSNDKSNSVRKSHGCASKRELQIC